MGRSRAAIRRMAAIMVRDAEGPARSPRPGRGHAAGAGSRAEAALRRRPWLSRPDHAAAARRGRARDRGRLPRADRQRRGQRRRPGVLHRPPRVAPAGAPAPGVDRRRCSALPERGRTARAARHPARPHDRSLGTAVDHRPRPPRLPPTAPARLRPGDRAPGARPPLPAHGRAARVLPPGSPGGPVGRQRLHRRPQLLAPQPGAGRVRRRRGAGAAGARAPPGGHAPGLVDHDARQADGLLRRAGRAQAGRRRHRRRSRGRVALLRRDGPRRALQGPGPRPPRARPQPAGTGAAGRAGRRQAIERWARGRWRGPGLHHRRRARGGDAGRSRRRATDRHPLEPDPLGGRALLWPRWPALSGRQRAAGRHAALSAAHPRRRAVSRVQVPAPARPGDRI